MIPSDERDCQAAILPADHYAAPDDLCVVVSYFNSHRYRTKRQNFERFAEPIRRSGIRLLVVECAFDAAPFELPASHESHKIRGSDVMWQKERLLNHAVAQLPNECRKVAWLDADILFENPHWAVETARLLDSFPVVQPFEQVIRLPRGAEAFHGSGDCWAGFAAIAARRPQAMTQGDFASHGHTGFGWAARRELLDDHGLYDACIAGSGDHMMAHAFAGDWSSPCIDRIVGKNSRLRRHFVAWCKRVYGDVRARIGYAKGTALHLWHGDVADRRYVDRNRELLALGFDPANDLRIAASGCWEWRTRKRELRDWARAYFGARREDGGA